MKDEKLNESNVSDPVEEKLDKANNDLEHNLKDSADPSKSSSSEDEMIEQLLEAEQKIEVRRDKRNRLLRDFEAQRYSQEKAEKKQKSVAKKSVSDDKKPKVKKAKKAKYKVDFTELEEKSEEKDTTKAKMALGHRFKNYFFGVGRELMRITYLKPRELKSDVIIILSVIVFFVVFLFLVDVIFILLNLGLI